MAWAVPVRHDDHMTAVNASGDSESSDATPTAQDPPDAAESEQDAARRRFREALDRKKSGRPGQSASADPKTQAVHPAPAKPQRTFRRKSG